MSKRARNADGYTLYQWLCAAGWGELWELVGNPWPSDKPRQSFEQLTAAWHNGADPSDWRVTAPKRREDMV